MKKSAQFQAMWPAIYRKLKNPPPGVNLGSFPSKLPPMNKIIIDPGRLSNQPQAVGYVTTEDVNDDGVLDTIHVASPRLEEAMNQAGVPLNKMQNLDQLSNEELHRVLTPFVELFSHELGHLEDYNPDLDNPFPGGEGAAESAARNAVQSISTTATNNRFKSKGRYGEVMAHPKVLKMLVNLGDYFDKKGSTEMADHVDALLQKYSQAIGDVDYSQVFNQQRPGSEPDMSSPEIPLSKSSPFRAPEPVAKVAPAVKPQKSVPPIRPPQEEYFRFSHYGYTYDYDPRVGTFEIVSTPADKTFALGRLIGEGDPGYDVLNEGVRKLMSKVYSGGYDSLRNMPNESMADDSLKEEKKEEKVEKEAGHQADELTKIASLKEDFSKIFWTNPKTPFNRSNSKFEQNTSSRLKI